MTLYGIIVKSDDDKMMINAFVSMKKAKKYLKVKANEYNSPSMKWSDKKDKVICDDKEIYIIKYKSFL